MCWFIGEMSLSNASCIDFGLATKRQLVVLALSHNSISVASVQITFRRMTFAADDDVIPSALFPTHLVEAVVQEECPRWTTVILMRAFNPKLTSCGDMRYDILSGNQRNEFVLQSTGDGGAALRTNRKLDREIRAEYRLQVRAVVGERCVDTALSNRHSAVATIIVTVADINDNSPFFPAFRQPIIIREGKLSISYSSHTHTHTHFVSSISSLTMKMARKMFSLLTLNTFHSSTI